ncbi:MAG: UPF0158 family protein [Bacteroidota bacterium]
MKKINDKTISEIADHIMMGERCFLDKKTAAIHHFPADIDDLLMAFSEEEEEYINAVAELEKIEDAIENYIEFEPLTSSESYDIMDDFVYEMQNSTLKEKLIHALNNKSPFANFKYLIDHSDQRQNWFDYRKKAYETHVRKTLEITE